MITTWAQRLIVAVLLCATAGAAVAVHMTTRRGLENRRADRLETVQNRLAESLRRRAFYLEDVADMVGVHDHGDASEFSRYAHVRGRYEPSIVSVQWVRRSPSGKLEPPRSAGRSPMLVAPSNRGNARIARVASAPAANQVLQRAAFQKQVSVSAPILLANGHHGFYLAVPVEARSFAGLLSRVESQSAIVGVVDAQTLVANELGLDSPAVRVHDRFRSVATVGTALDHPVETTLRAAGRTWTVTVAGGSLTTLEKTLSWLILVLGTGLAAAVAIVLRTSGKRRDAALRLAEERLARVRRVNLDLEQAREDADHRSRIDPLTGIYNRRHFTEVLTKEFRHADGVASAVLLLDLDHFKKVNDEHGHLTGDAVLRAVASRLTSIMRDTDCLARWGGEEFAILAPGMDRCGMVTLAERARRALGNSPIVIGDVTLELRLSVGAALTNPNMGTPDEIVDAADQALYEAKHAGRDCVRVYEHDATPA